MDVQYKPDNPMVITLNHFERLRNQFTQHYFLAACDTNFGGQDIQVSWNSFSLAVYNFISANKLTDEQIAIRFVHCYDPKANLLYLRMQIMTMVPADKINHKYNLVDSPSVWYKLANGTIVPTEDTNLYDEAYLQFFYYCEEEACTAATLNNLAKDTKTVFYARTITMPWQQELQLLYTDNNSPQNCTLCFAAGGIANAKREIEYQHTLVAYLRASDGTPLLDNKQYEQAFKCKGADTATMCPPTCNDCVIPKPSSGGDGCDDKE